MTATWNSQLPKVADARLAMQAVIDLAQDELPFAAQVAKLAMDAATLTEAAYCLVSVYRIALEHGHPFLPDLVDGLLRWIEDYAPEAIDTIEVVGSGDARDILA
jgi:hypothetical protein